MSRPCYLALLAYTFSSRQDAGFSAVQRFRSVIPGSIPKI